MIHRNVLRQPDPGECGIDGRKVPCQPMFQSRFGSFTWALCPSGLPAACSHHRAYRMDVASCFHPAVAAWFNQSFTAPTAAQAQAWPAIQAGRHVLIAAPTGSGKTLAAFLAAIDTLVRQGLDGRLENETQVVYVSPLKALSNDINRQKCERYAVSAET